MVELEDKFLDLVFDMGDIQGLTKKICMLTIDI